MTMARRFRTDVQGLRAVAVLLVVLYHAGLHVPGGFTGVDVFFVISGYVICGLLVRELETRNGLSFGRFYARRAMRLLPALGAMVTLVTLLGIVAAPITGQRDEGWTGIWSLLFAANAYLYRAGADYFQTAASFDPLTHLWTLAVEEQFYLVFPLVLLVFWRRGARRAAAVVMSAAVGVSFALSLALSEGRLLADAHRPQQLAFYGSPTRAWEFALGALIALAPPRSTPRLAQGLAAVGIAAIVAGAFLITSTRTYPGVAALLPVLGTGAVILAGARTSTVVSRALGSRPFTWVGDRSYSWYLWHWPLIVYAHALAPNNGWLAPVAAFASLVPAAILYAHLENPLRRARFGAHRVVAVAASVAAVAGIACGVLVAAHHLVITQTAQGREWKSSQEPHVDFAAGCEGSTGLVASSLGRCTWHVPNPVGRVVLIGDSNASTLSDAVVAAARDTHFDLSIATFYGCPFAAVRVVGSSAGERECEAFNTRSMQTLLRLKPSLVITTARAEFYSDGEFGLAPAHGPVTYDPRRQLEIWTAGLAIDLRRLTSAGIRVLVVDPYPRILSQPNESECAVVLVLVRRCAGTESRASVERELAPVLRAQAEAIRRAGGRVRTATIVDRICTRTTCSSRRGSRLLYTDFNHLSVFGAQLTTPIFVQAIRRDAAGAPIR